MKTGMKKLLVMTLVPAMLLPFAACSNGTESQGGGTGASQDGGGTAGETVTIDWWLNDPESWCEGYREIIAQYEEQNEGIKIAFASYPEDYRTKLQAAVAAGTEPDIYNEVIPQDAGEPFLDLTPYMEEDGFDPDEIYWQPYFDMWCTYDDKIYALPRDIFSTVICYNKDLFDEYNVPYPEDGWTMEEFMETARQLTDPDNNKFGVLFTEDFYTYFPLIWSFGADQLADDGSTATGYMDSDAMQEFWQFMYDLTYTENVSPTPSQTNAFGAQDAAGGGVANIFQMGNVAMTAIERYAVGDYQAADMDIGVVSFPVNEEGEQWAYGSMVTWSISKNSDNPDEAWDFLKFAAGPEGSRILTDSGYFFPAVKSVAEDLDLANDPIEGVFLDQFNEANLTKMPFVWRRPDGFDGVYSPDVQAPWDDAYQKIMVAQEDIRTTIDTAASEMNKQIEDFAKQKGVE